MGPDYYSTTSTGNSGDARITGTEVFNSSDTNEYTVTYSGRNSYSKWEMKEIWNQLHISNLIASWFVPFKIPIRKNFLVSKKKIVIRNSLPYKIRKE